MAKKAAPKKRIIKGRDYNENKASDGARKAKSGGWRMAGTSRKPTKKEIQAHYDGASNGVYMENRIARMDKNPRAKKGERFENGGEVGKKKFSENYNVGKSKYVINYHDGVKTHKDGSEFYDIEIFKNKKDLEAFKSKLLKEGYVSKYEKGGEVNDSDIKELSNGYKEAILFTGYDEDEVELDANYSISDFDSKANAVIEKMAKQYIVDNKDAIKESGLDYGTIGRDIWYAQAGHGVGFFDEELDKDVEDKLTKGAKKFGDLSHNVFAQDGKVYLEGMKFAKGGEVKNKKVDKVKALLIKNKVETDDVSPNFVNDFAHENGITDLTSQEVVEISDTYEYVKSNKFAKGGKIDRTKSTKKTRVNRTKKAIAQDKNIKALHAGKRESESGFYYEYRENRSDKNRTKKLATGGSVGEDTMYNFLTDDLDKLQKAIKEGDKEDVDKFFSYWGHHLKSLKTKNNDRMYNFLKDDLEKLEKAVSNGDNEEVDRFFLYWNQHLSSLKMAKGGDLKNYTSADLPKDGSAIEIHMPEMGKFPAEDIVLKYNQDNFAFDAYRNGELSGTRITEKQVLDNLNNGSYEFKIESVDSEEPFKEGDKISFNTSSNADDKRLEGTISNDKGLGLVVKSDDQVFELRKLIDIEKLGKYAKGGKLAPVDSSSFNTNYRKWFPKMHDLVITKFGKEGYISYIKEGSDNEGETDMNHYAVTEINEENPSERKEADIWDKRFMVRKDEMKPIEKFEKGGKIKLREIEDETVLLPYVIAEPIAETAAEITLKDEFSKWKDLSDSDKKSLDEKYKNLVDEISVYLVKRANTVYTHNKSFEKDVKGKKGREVLNTFMEHWCGLVDGKLVKPISDTMARYEKESKSASFEDGGEVSFENKYEGHSTEEVWNGWNESQRSHFLLDHSELLDNDRIENNLGHSRTVQKDKNYSELTPHTKRVLESHVEKGQYKKGGEIVKFEKLKFNSHKNHNPKTDILEGHIDGDSFITYGIDVNGDKKGTEHMEYYKGSNFVVGSKKPSSSRHYTKEAIPAKWKASWEELKKEYEEKYSKEEFEEGGHIGFDKLAKKVAKEYEGDKVKPEYQAEYGKTYDKEEAKEVGQKVAAKVYHEQNIMGQGGEIKSELTLSEIEIKLGKTFGFWGVPYEINVDGKTYRKQFLGKIYKII